MTNSVLRNKTISTRVTEEVSDRAKANLAKEGLTVSEYVRLALIKAANNEVELVNFLDTPEALAAKKEVENGQVERIGDLDDLKAWVNRIDGNTKK
ncbi:RelB [Lentilactobacillus parakefiri]|uniref:plasmid mobilization protein n=1 Tax=Lentilactobacillus parakefiri TaxID=152332 RepID=UPI000BA62E97|nr:type II toxin-antitoxin system RelB/DinJ family antitoxin [Lentilactobacillus parakefiri]PAL01527.1 RelB [Lentilactobacillus parakefiri]